jgi:vacuolar-type H+-ATPase subunit I/STV1
MCGLWVHLKPCSLVSDEGFKFLSEQLQATGQAYWGCRPCVSYSQAITKKVREVEKKLDEVQKEVKDNTKAIDKVDKNVEELRKEIDTIKNSRSDESAGYLTAEEYREREARKVNLIMHRVRESEEESAELRRKADMLECSTIFRAAGVAEQAARLEHAGGLEREEMTPAQLW